MIPAVVARTLAVLLVTVAWSPRLVRADAVVGTGTAGSCTEAALNAATISHGRGTGCGGAIVNFGDSSGPTCSFDDPATLAASSPWPKFHHDQQNTGAVANANLASNPGTCRWVFPPGDLNSCTAALSTPPKGAFAAPPVIDGGSGDGKRIYIGSADGTLYALDAEHGTRISSFNFAIAGPITSAALAATRPIEGEVVFVGGGNGYLYGLTDSAAAQPSYWPSAIGGSINGAPNIGADGTVYASLTGGIAGVCPNGIERFALFSTGSLYSPAQATDGTLYFGGDDHLLRAMQTDGNLKWSFSAAGPILTAPLFDADTNSIYAADRSGRVFKVETDGRLDEGFAFGPVGPISSSPAVAGDHLYFGSDDGNVYAVNTTTGSKATGHADWTFPTGARVFSSPAVATNPGSPAIVVIGSDDGNVYFLEDNTTRVTLLATFSIGAPVRSSPAIDSDGTVYVGADDGRVYAIGTPLPSPCCQCPTSCAAPVNGWCAECTAVSGAACESGQLCVLYTATPTAPTRTPTRTPTPTPVTPSPTPTATATDTPGTNDCCQCATFCGPPIAGTCGGCAVVFGASCTSGGLCARRTPLCAGDCNDDGTVTVDEILTMVNIALGNAPVDDCLAGDVNGDGQITVDEILAAVNKALRGCGGG